MVLGENIVVATNTTEPYFFLWLVNRISPARLRKEVIFDDKGKKNKNIAALWSADTV